MLKLYLLFTCLPLLAATNSYSSSDEEPEFMGDMQNVTAPAGRTVRLSCSVKNLGTYKVAWMQFEQSAILTVHTHVITRNPRISVKHDNHRTWNLIITDVKEEDGGRYMCQINTATAKTQFGYLQVVIPPDIIDALSSTDLIVREGSNLTLSCAASGSPEPVIKWRRDDGQMINLNKTVSVSDVESPTLEMHRISRIDMGAYLCIASNGVPPTVSKRIRVSVDFPPSLSIPHQLVGCPIGKNVTLECIAEAHPNSLNYWTREDGQMIHDNKRYLIQMKPTELSYKTQMLMTIIKLRKQDIGAYKCVAKNPRGETDGNIRVYETPIIIDSQENTAEPIKPRQNKGVNGIQPSQNNVDKQMKMEDDKQVPPKDRRAGSSSENIGERHSFQVILLILCTSIPFILTGA